MMMRNHNEILIQKQCTQAFIFLSSPCLDKAMQCKLLQRFNVDVVITAICMGRRCFISVSVCRFLIKTSIPIYQLFGITYWCVRH